MTMFGFLKIAAKHTIKGAAITTVSTVGSIGLACYIERGGHQLVYKFFPHKYANVQHANGLTQEQLDAVRVYNNVNVNDTTSAAVDEINKNDDDLVVMKMEEEENKMDDEKKKTGEKNAPDNNNDDGSTRFWNDIIPKQINDAAQVIPTQDILACAMTG